jgi:transcriptional regulator with XRE-family HTH domain
MNAIEQLQAQLGTALPAAKLELRKPRSAQGTWWLDATLDDHWVSIEWSPRRGFGLTASVLGDGYGEGREEVFRELSGAFERARTLLADRRYTRPPLKVLLQELRARLSVTQQQLAEKLGVRQAAVSRLERRHDITLTSLLRYVEALGGALEITFRNAKGEAWSLLPSAFRPAEVSHARRHSGGVRPPSLEGLVLRCEKLQASREFYSQLGCALTEEKHGDGPLHYSFASSGLILELYPSSSKHPPSREVRLTLQVNKPRERLRDLEASNLLRPGPTVKRASTFVVRDPDDNVIELKDLATPSNIPSPP